MRTDIEPNFAADQYSKMLHTYFDNTGHSFDLVLLGMGSDGHTLSLFPGSPIIEENNNWVNAVYNKEQEMYRITLMPLLVNQSSKIAFMVDGDNKASVLKEVLEGDYNPTKYAFTTYRSRRRPVALVFGRSRSKRFGYFITVWTI